MPRAGRRQPWGSLKLCPKNPLQIPWSWNLALARANFVLGVARTPLLPPYVILLHLLRVESCPELRGARECCAEPSRLGPVTLLGTLGWQGLENHLPCSHGSSRLCWDMRL